MGLELVLKSSVIEFEDKHYLTKPITGKNILDEEEIRTSIPELNLGERIVLNAYGSYEVHHYDEYRRRLGIYRVISKKEESDKQRYVLRRIRDFKEAELVNSVLSNDTNIKEGIKGLRYIALDRYGHSLTA